MIFFFPTMAETEKSCEPSSTALSINFGPPGPLLLMPERAETPRGRVNFDVFAGILARIFMSISWQKGLYELPTILLNMGLAPFPPLK